MAEAAEAVDGPEPETAVDPSAAAIALALDEARANPGLEEDVRAFLADQRRLISEQLHHLREQYRQLKLRHWSERLKLGFQLFAALAATVAALILATVLWQATTDRSLVVDALSVPPDFSARGLTSRAVSAKLLDELVAIEAHNSSARAANTYANAWDGEVKIDIPETGVSISEAEQLLHKLLGHETHISGEIFQDGKGLVVAVRTGSGAAQEFKGSEDEYEDLVRKAAESIYRQTQPYLYARYLQLNGRSVEARAAYRDLIDHGASLDQIWARVGLSRTLTNVGDVRGAEALDREDTIVAPDFFLGHSDLADDARALGHDGEARSEIEAALQSLPRTSGDVSPDAAGSFRLRLQSLLAESQSDFAAAAEDFRKLGRLKSFNDSVPIATCLLPQDLALQHDLDAAIRSLPGEYQAGDAGGMDTVVPARGDFGCLPVFTRLRQAGDWAGALRDLQGLSDAPAIQGAAYSDFRTRVLRPWLALATAKAGDVRKASALLQGTPRDCYLCTRVEGEVAVLAGDVGASERAFAAAARQAPDLPVAYQDWGEARLARGDLAGADWTFREAQRRAPRWADPAKGLGDVAARRGDWREAVNAYDSALSQAPAWAELKQARAAAAAHLR